MTVDESDEALMVKVAQGDKRAFSTLFDRHVGAVAHFAFRFVGDRGRAEELAQDVFVKLFRGAKGYRPEAKFKTYLFRVATNHCLNEVRRGEHKVAKDTLGEEATYEVPSHHTPDEALWGAQLERAVGEALLGLPERERAAFSMCRFEGMAYKDIAFALSASEAAVKSLIHRASLAVAKKLEEVGATPLWQRSRA